MKKSKEILLLIILVFSLIPTILFVSNIKMNIDFTENKKFTIKESTRRYLEKFEQPLYITWWKSSGLESPQLDILSDLLLQLESLPLLEISIDIKNPENDEVKSLKEKGLLEEQIEGEIYFSGLEISYLGDSVIVPFLINPDFLEFYLLESLSRIKNSRKYNVAIFPDSTSAKPNGSYTILTSGLSELFNVFSVSEENPLTFIPDVMIVPDRKDYSLEELFAIDSTIQTGKPVIFLIDGLSIDPEANDYAVPNDEPSIIHRWLQNYGLDIGDALISDANSLKFNYVSDNSMRYSNYDFWFKNDDYLDVLWSSPILVSAIEGISSTILVQSSKQSWLNEGETDIRPVFEKKNYISTGPYNVGIQLEGHFKPLFQSTKTSSADGLIVVYSSTLSFSDLIQTSGSFSNINYLRSTIFKLLGEEELHSLSSGIIHRNLMNSEELTFGFKQKIVKLLNLLIIPMGIIIMYMVVIRKRKKDIEK